MRICHCGIYFSVHFLLVMPYFFGLLWMLFLLVDSGNIAKFEFSGWYNGAGPNVLRIFVILAYTVVYIFLIVMMQFYFLCLALPRLRAWTFLLHLNIRIWWSIFIDVLLEFLIACCAILVNKITNVEVFETCLSNLSYSETEV